MKFKLTIFLTMIVAFSCISNAQSTDANGTTTVLKKAQYSNGDLTKELTSKVNYPQNCFNDKITGKVILSIKIQSNGLMDSIMVLSSPNIDLSKRSIDAVKKLKNEWSPAEADNIPYDKTYMIVFNFSILLESELQNYQEDAAAYLKRGKNQKALKTYNEAINENPFQSDLFQSRSKLKAIMGDTLGAEEDRIQSQRLYNEVLAVINASIIGYTHKKVVTKSYVVVSSNGN